MLITEHYREQNRQLHDKPNLFAVFGWRRARKALKLIRAYRVESALDYGCGKRTLWRACRRRLGEGFRWQNYDPCIEGLDRPPEAADLVICGDALEHIEPVCLDAVLDDLRRLTRKVTLLCVSTQPGNRTLPDGRNTHLIVEPAEWWLRRIEQRFERVEFQSQRRGKEFSFVGTPRA